VTSEHLAAVDAILQLEHGILPAAGGMEDQSATFAAAYSLLRGELAHWREVADQDALARAKAKR
jgi:hypothetical protein